MPAATRSPGLKLLFALLSGALLAIPLFAMYLMVYDRRTQSETARTEIAQGWGGAQVLAAPVLVLPYQEQVTETVNENGKQVQHTKITDRELVVSPDTADVRTTIVPQTRRKSIYEAVVYEAAAGGTERFSLPVDLSRSGVKPEQLAYDRAELRVGLSDARGLFGRPPALSVDGQVLRLQPGHGPSETGGAGFFAYLDAGAIRTRGVTVAFRLGFRGNGSLALAPGAGDTRWHVTSPWPSPSFGGGFLPVRHAAGASGFDADWRVGNLALGRPLLNTGNTTSSADGDPTRTESVGGTGESYQASVDLVSPVDLYSEVNRSVKYGFLFIGFTFVAFLLFDVIGGVRVAVAEYLLVGAALVLFFALLLGLAEVIGFTPAYLLAPAAVIVLLAAYSAAVLRSWRRGGYIAGLLVALYGVLYVLLSLEAYSLLIGSLLLFAALAGIMYLTRRLDWSGLRAAPAPTAA